MRVPRLDGGGAPGPARLARGREEGKRKCGRSEREGDGRSDTGTTKRIAEAGTYKVHRARLRFSYKIGSGGGKVRVGNAPASSAPDRTETGVYSTISSRAITSVLSSHLVYDARHVLESP